jgi:hypothetical protein
MAVKFTHAFSRGCKFLRLPKRFMENPEPCGALPMNSEEKRSLRTAEMITPRIHGVAGDSMGITSEVGVSSFSSQSVL